MDADIDVPLKMSAAADIFENGCTYNPLTLWAVPVLVPVWVHILGAPQRVFS